MEIEKQLIDKAESYELLVENSLDLIAIVQDNKWKYVNTSGLLLLNADYLSEIVDKSIYDFMHPDFHPICKQRGQILKNERKPVDFLEQVWFDLEGNEIIVEVCGIPTFYKDQYATQIIARDVTFRKKTEKALIESEKLRITGQIAADIAHE